MEVPSIGSTWVTSHTCANLKACSCFLERLLFSIRASLKSLAGHETPLHVGRHRATPRPRSNLLRSRSMSKNEAELPFMEEIWARGDAPHGRTEVRVNGHVKGWHRFDGCRAIALRWDLNRQPDRTANSLYMFWKQLKDGSISNWETTCTCAMWSC